MSRQEKLTEFLQDNGPSTRQEIEKSTGISSPARRFNRVAELRINPDRSAGSSVGSSGTVKRIVYLEDRHRKIEIVKKWIDVHSDKLDDIPDRSISMSTPREFRDAMSNFISPSGGGSGENGGHGGSCALCGEDYDGRFDKHLEYDCEG